MSLHKLGFERIVTHHLLNNVSHHLENQVDIVRCELELCLLQIQLCVAYFLWRRLIFTARKEIAGR